MAAATGITTLRLYCTTSVKVCCPGFNRTNPFIECRYPSQSGRGPAKRAGLPEGAAITRRQLFAAGAARAAARGRDRARARAAPDRRGRHALPRLQGGAARVRAPAAPREGRSAMTARASLASASLSRARTGRAGGATPASRKSAARAAPLTGKKKGGRPFAALTAPLKRCRAASAQTGSPVQTP